MADERNNDRIGALWTHQSRGGDDYFTGVVEFGDVKQKVVVFHRRPKEGDDPGKKYPDWYILKDKPKDIRGDEDAPI